MPAFNSDKHSYNFVMPAEYDLGGKVEKAHSDMGFEKLEIETSPETDTRFLNLKTNLPGKSINDLVGFYWQSFLLNQSARTNLKRLFGRDFERIIDNAEKEGANWKNILNLDPTYLFNSQLNSQREESDSPLIIEGSSYNKLYEKTREKLKNILSKACNR